MVRAQWAGSKTLNKLIAQKHTRVFRYLVVPALVTVWLVGWVFYWLGLR